MQYIGVTFLNIGKPMQLFLLSVNQNALSLSSTQGFVVQQFGIALWFITIQS